MGSIKTNPMSKIYSEKLLDPRWQKRRLDILSRDEFTCKLCGDKKTTLHVHHKSYIKGRQPWDYKDENFQTLCQICHSVVEFFKKSNVNIIAVDKYSLVGGSEGMFAIDAAGICYVMKYENNTVTCMISFLGKTLKSMENFYNIVNSKQKKV